MEPQEEIQKRLLSYVCCVLVFACVVMLGSQFTIPSWIVDVLIRPAVRILLAFSESSVVLRLFELFPHFASKILPFLYAAVLFSPLIGYGISGKKIWLKVQAGFAILHMVLFFLSL